MSKVSKVLLDIRDTLSDPSGDRWDDARLIRAINDAMSDINTKAKILRSKLSFDILEGSSTYELGDEVQIVTRATYKTTNVEFKTHEEMDLYKPSWEEDTADDDVKYIVYDKLNKGQIRLYPTPATDVAGETLGFGVVVGSTGVSFNSVFGVVTQLDGVTTGSSIVVYYIKKPVIVTSVTDELELDSSWDKAIKYYVCGHTLRDDKDTQNRTFGNEELQLYVGELQVAVTQSAKDFTNARQYQSHYRGAF